MHRDTHPYPSFQSMTIIPIWNDSLEWWLQLSSVLEDDIRVGRLTTIYIDTCSVSHAYKKRNTTLSLLSMIAFFKIILLPLHFLWRSSLSSIKTMAKGYHQLYRCDVSSLTNLEGQTPPGKREVRKIVRRRRDVDLFHPILVNPFSSSLENYPEDTSLIVQYSSMEVRIEIIQCEWSRWEILPGENLRCYHDSESSTSIFIDLRNATQRAIEQEWTNQTEGLSNRKIIFRCRCVIL